MLFALSLSPNPADPVAGINYILWIALAAKILSLGLLGYFAKKCFDRLHAEMQNQAPTVETSWGGLGGGLGGWTASKSLVWLTLTLLTLLCFVAVAVQLTDGLVSTSKPAAATEQKKEAQKESSGSSANETKPEPAKTDSKTDSAGKKDETKSEPAKNQ